MSYGETFIKTKLQDGGLIAARIQYGAAFPVAHIKTKCMQFDINISGLAVHDVDALCNYLMHLKQRMIELHEDAID